MNKETEKLKERIETWLPSDMPNKGKVVTAILCECKEAGLQFVPKKWRLTGIDPHSVSIDECNKWAKSHNAQIGEIEINA